VEELLAPDITSTELPPIAKYRGEAIHEMPKDLFIPPDALEVFLDAFEGPLDLLLYLIRKQNLDILDIPIALLTKQYIEYVELMAGMRLELAADYLLMAAILAEIKSRMLLPRSPDAPEEEDPRMDLVRRLQEYERFKIAAEQLDELERLERDIFLPQVETPDLEHQRPLAPVTLQELLLAFKDVLKRAELNQSHQVLREPLSIRERMTQILTIIGDNPDYISFSTCFSLTEGRAGAIVTFIAILELLKQSMIDIIQTEIYSPIRIKAR
jgi:segregation and condensation protein A